MERSDLNIQIPSLQDKIVQKATGEVLNAIYEQDFLECSYGFRPGRGPHQALDEVGRVICTRPTELDPGIRYHRILRCARLSPALPAGETPAPERVEPPHWESSLGLMKVTT